MTKMLVDFSALVRDGLLRGNSKRADGPLHIGSMVELYDPDEPDMIYDAEVVDIDRVTGRTYLRVFWEPVAACVPSEWMRLSEATTGGVAATLPVGQGLRSALSGLNGEMAEALSGLRFGGRGGSLRQRTA